MKISPGLLVPISILIVVASARTYSQAPQAKTLPTPVTSASPDTTVTATQIVSTKQLAELADSLEIKGTMKDRLNNPKFFINEDTFFFYEGSVPTLGDEVITPRAYPLLIPLARKLQLDDLRQFLKEQPEANGIQWTNSLKLADAILAQKSLALIASDKLSGEELVSKLYEYDASISVLFDKTAREFAESRNLKYKRAATASLATHTVPVSFVLNPTGAHLFVIPYTLYASDGSTDKLWRSILEPSPRLGGTYYYKVTWPNGQITPPTLLPKVEKAGQVFTINQ